MGNAGSISVARISSNKPFFNASAKFFEPYFLNASSTVKSYNEYNNSIAELTEWENLGMSRDDWVEFKRSRLSIKDWQEKGRLLLTNGKYKKLEKSKVYLYEFFVPIGGYASYYTENRMTGHILTTIPFIAGIISWGVGPPTEGSTPFRMKIDRFGGYFGWAYFITFFLEKIYSVPHNLREVDIYNKRSIDMIKKKYHLSFNIQHQNNGIGLNFVYAF